jgi:hypothetical protein
MESIQDQEVIPIVGEELLWYPDKDGRPGGYLYDILARKFAEEFNLKPNESSGNQRLASLFVLREPYSTHPATVVLIQQRLTTFRRYQYATPRVLTQDSPSLLSTRRLSALSCFWNDELAPPSEKRNQVSRAPKAPNCSDITLTTGTSDGDYRSAFHFRISSPGHIWGLAPTLLEWQGSGCERDFERTISDDARTWLPPPLSVSPQNLLCSKLCNFEPECLCKLMKTDCWLDLQSQ